VERLVVRSEKLFELSYSWFSTKPIVVGAIPKAIRVRRWNLEFYCNCFYSVLSSEILVLRLFIRLKRETTLI